MSLFGKSTSKNANSSSQYVVWKCRYCGKTTKTLPFHVPGNAVGGACRVINGKTKPHEWIKG